MTPSSSGKIRAFIYSSRKETVNLLFLWKHISHKQPFSKLQKLATKDVASDFSLFLRFTLFLRPTIPDISISGIVKKHVRDKYNARVFFVDCKENKSIDNTALSAEKLNSVLKFCLYENRMWRIPVAMNTRSKKSLGKKSYLPTLESFGNSRSLREISAWILQLSKSRISRHLVSEMDYRTWILCRRIS